MVMLMHWYIYNINQYIGNFKVDHVCIWSYSSSSVWRPFAILIIVVVIKQSHSFFWIWRTFICMSMLAIIDKDISFFAGQIIYAVLYGVTSAAYVLLTTLVGLLSCGDIMIHTSRFWWWYLWYIHTLMHWYIFMTNHCRHFKIMPGACWSSWRWRLHQCIWPAPSFPGGHHIFNISIGHQDYRRHHIMKIVAIMIVKSRSIFDIKSIKIINQQYEIFFCFERDH